MFRRRTICALLLLLTTSTVHADPVLLFLLRMVRDQVISASLEAGVSSLRSQPAPPTPTFGYVLPTPPVERGTEEERLRIIIDDSFLHLSSDQRAAVFAGMRKILSDPQNAQARPQIVAEFTVHARAVRESYRVFEKLSSAEKRDLALQARDEFRRLSGDERQQLLELLRSRTLPVPRDFNDILLGELTNTPGAALASPRLN